jgi:hypothetical protein
LTIDIEDSAAQRVSAKVRGVAFAQRVVAGGRLEIPVGFDPVGFDDAVTVGAAQQRIGMPVIDQRKLRRLLV